MKSKPCPFCMSKNTMITSHGEFHTVNCLSCFACGPQHETQDGAVQLWNKRERKEKTMKQLKTQAYKYAQLKARLEGTDENGYGTCWYCGKVQAWSELQGCHWITKGSGAATATSLHPSNIHPGCGICNNLNKNVHYTLRMQKEYGDEGIQMLLDGDKAALKDTDLKEFIEKTRKECRELAKKKSFKVNVP